jgi:cobalt/nickel transport system ATP-binding protein
VTSPLIEVRGLFYTYEDGTPALGGVDFELHPRETVAVLGPNGSGKTTFLLHLTGLLKGEGEIRVCGLPMCERNHRQIRQRAGIVFQNPDDQLFLPTVLEDTMFGPVQMGLNPKQAETRARAALRRVGMEAAAERAPYRLSAGEKKRVSIAGVLAMEPEILILDEPTTFLDPPGQAGLVALLSELPQAKILVTHNLEFAGALATRAVFFENGRIAAQGSLSHVVTRSGWSRSESPQRAKV